MFSDQWLCLTDHQPPILGTKKDICEGNTPENGLEMFDRLTELFRKNKTHWFEEFDQEKEDLDEEHAKDISSWTVGLVLGLFITMIITAIATAATVKFCCA